MILGCWICLFNDDLSFYKNFGVILEFLFLEVGIDIKISSGCIEIFWGFFVKEEKVK